MKTMFKNPQITHELERIQGYDNPVIKKDEYTDGITNEKMWTIEAGDNTIIYHNRAERDQDFNTLKNILKPTEVVFRTYPARDGQAKGDVIALFPYDVNRQVGFCESYMHIGQHGTCDYEGVIRETKPATPEEYTDLKTELENYGPVEAHYNLKVIKQWSRAKHIRAVEAMRKAR